MATTLFNIMFSKMVIDAFHYWDASFRFACKRYDLRWLKDKTKVQNGVLDKLLYEDVKSKNAKTYRSNRKAMNRNWSNQRANPALKTKTGNK